MMRWNGSHWADVEEIVLDIDDMLQLQDDREIIARLADGTEVHISIAEDALHDCRQRELFEPEHTGMHPKRLRASAAERIYAEHWRRENERLSYANNGFTTLEWILCPEGQRYPMRVTQQIASICATVVQWFGTNCGCCFINSCEREIERERAERRKWDRFQCMNRPMPVGMSIDSVHTAIEKIVEQITTGMSLYWVKNALMQVLFQLHAEMGASSKSSQRKIEVDGGKR